MTHAEQFISEIEAFLKRTGMSPTRFGIAAVNDPSLVRDLRADRVPNLRLVDRVHEFMRSYQQGDQDQDAHGDERTSSDSIHENSR